MPSDPEEQAAQRATAERDRLNKLSERLEIFKKQLVFRLCYAYLSRQLRQDGVPDRQVTQRLGGFRRRVHSAAVDYRQLRYITGPQLEPELAAQLRQDLDVLEAKLATPIPPNDLVWLLEAGAEGDPPKHLLEQQYQILLAQRFRADLVSSDTQQFAAEVASIATLGFYQESLFVVWPLLDSSTQLSLQAWFRRYRQGLHDGGVREELPWNDDSPQDRPRAVHDGAADHDDDDVDTVPEPASGSGDRPSIRR
ncbi:sec31 [Symbiodinium sp. CCMP2592]|nr:sec31 [Symbiodinium sp. CCMP2592]